MAKVNPYRPPRDAEEMGCELDGVLRVDGQQLVIADKAILPNRCALTNRHPCNQRAAPRLISSNFWGALPTRHCTIVYVLSDRWQRRYWRRRWLVWIARTCCFVGVVIGIFLSWWKVIDSFTFQIALPALLLNVFLSRVRVDPFQVTLFENGQYWIDGFGQEFLESIRCQLEDGNLDNASTRF